MDLLNDIMVTRDIKIFEKDRMRHCYTLVEDMINNELPDDVLKLLFEGYNNDLDDLLDNLVKESYRILYGKYGEIKPVVKEVNELNQFLEDELRKQDCVYFAQSVLSEFDVNWHHIEWSALINKYDQFAVLAARDHGKSWFWSLAYPLWRAFRYNRYSPNKYDRLGRLGYLFSSTSPLASELLEIVKAEVEGNDFLRDRLYPDNRDNWSQRTLKFKNGATLRARGFGASVRGGHPGFIICDDVVKDNVLYSDIQRERNKDYFNGAILNMLVPGGQIGVIGTPFHFKDLYSLFAPRTKKQETDLDLMYKEVGWVLCKYPAIDNMGRLLWAERHNQDSLDRKKSTQGSLVFSRELLCEPITSDSSLFPMRLLQKAIQGMEHYVLVGNVEAFPIKMRRIVTGADFALSAETGSDNTAFLTWGEDDFKNRWLMNMYHENGVGFYDQITALKSIGQRFKPDIMLLEGNQFQSIYSEVLKADTSLPIKPFVTTKKKSDLSSGVPGLVLNFENNRIKLPRGDEYSIVQTNKLMNEFNHIAFTDKGIQGVGEHDDIVMATWLSNNGFEFDDGDFLFDMA